MSNEKFIHYSVRYNFIRGRQLEGTLSKGPSIGMWNTTSMRIHKGWGSPIEDEWPYKNESEWPPEEPIEIDNKAKKNRIRSYQRCRTVLDCKIALSKNHPISASFDITDQWFAAQDGMIDLPNSEDEIIGGHAIALIGYDDASRTFKFMNSWGEEWGDKGFGYLPYEFFDKYMTEAWFMHSKPVYNFNKGQDKVSITWWDNDIFGNPFYGIEIYDKSNDENIAWAFVVTKDNYLEVEELFVRPEHRNKGCGKALIGNIKEITEKMGLPIKFWIPHCDTITNVAIIEKLISTFGLVLIDSGVNWATYSTISDKGEHTTSENKRSPALPHMWYFT